MLLSFLCYIVFLLKLWTTRSASQRLVTCNEALQNIHPFEDGSGQARLHWPIHAATFTFGIPPFSFVVVLTELSASLSACLYCKGENGFWKLKSCGRNREDFSQRFSVLKQPPVWAANRMIQLRDDGLVWIPSSVNARKMRQHYFGVRLHKGYDTRLTAIKNDGKIRMQRCYTFPLKTCAEQGWSFLENSRKNPGKNF